MCPFKLVIGVILEIFGAKGVSSGVTCAQSSSAFENNFLKGDIFLITISSF